jgi:3,4-dihydroxy 2-butanone 4-phosphate synthase/GTP cyclohydrolase II
MKSIGETTREHTGSNTRGEAGRHLTVPEAAADLRAGRILLIYDDTYPNTVMLCLPAQFARPDNLQTLLQLAQQPFQPLSLVLSRERLDALRLTETNEATLVETPRYDGQIANRYAASIRALLHPLTRQDDFTLPRDLQIVRPRPGGVLQHPGFAEAALDLMSIAGLEAGAVLYPTGISTMDPDAFEALNHLATQWQINLLSITTLQRYRREHRVSLVTETSLPTPEATFRLLHFQEIETGEPYLVLTLGDIRENQHNPPLLRLHSSCTTGDIFGSQRCDCQAQMHSALHQIAQEGRGIFLYLPQEGRGIGLSGKLQAYVLQEQGYDTLEANEELGYPIDARNYESALEILRAMGITAVRLLTNNPDKIQAVRAAGISVESVPLQTTPTPSNLRYLQTKQQRFGHLLFSLQANE